MDNQHQKIKGYRDLNQDEIDIINEIKEKGEELSSLFLKLQEIPDTDRRWLAIAKTDIQKGFMALIRSIAKPTTF